MNEKKPQKFNFSEWREKHGGTSVDATPTPTPEVDTPAIKELQIDLRKSKGEFAEDRRIMRASLNAEKLWGSAYGYCAIRPSTETINEVKVNGYIASDTHRNSVKCCTLRTVPETKGEQFPFDHKSKHLIAHMQDFDLRVSHGAFAVYDLKQLTLSENSTYTFNHVGNRRAALLGIVKVTF